MVADLLMELHARQQTMLIVVTHSAALAARFPLRYELRHANLTLLARNLTWYWRTNLAVLLGVATATGVLGGAALVGESVRASLRDLVLTRLGNTVNPVVVGGLLSRGAGDGAGALFAGNRTGGDCRQRQSGKRASGVQVLRCG